MKKRFMIVSGAVLAMVLLGASLVVPAFAQEETPEEPFGCHGGGFGLGPGSWTMFDTVAEVLGLTPEELFSELHAGNSLEEIAEEQGVNLEDVHDAMQAARAEAMRERIEQAVEDGRISQEQADWLLEGLEQGFFPMGRGFGSGHGRRGGSGRGMKGGFGGFGSRGAPSAAPSL